MKPQVYSDPRPPELFHRYHERVRTRGPDWVYPLARMLLTPPSLLLYRPSSIGTENVPERGPVILAPNHFSNFDHFFLGLFLRRQVQFMAKSQLFRFPLDFILSHGGSFPVRRGQHDHEAFETAHAIFRQGGVVGMYAEGGRSRSKQLGKPKSGLGRLALESGAPVTPVAIHGSEHVRDLRRLRFPKVTIQYGEPLVFERVERPDREQCQRASAQVFERVREMYETLNAKGRRAVAAGLRARRAKDERDRARTWKPQGREAAAGGTSPLDALANRVGGTRVPDARPADRQEPEPVADREPERPGSRVA